MFSIKVVNEFYGDVPAYPYFEGTMVEFSYVTQREFLNLRQRMSGSDRKVTILFDMDKIDSDANILMFSFTDENRIEHIVFTTKSVVYLMNDLGSTIDSFKTT